MRVGECGLEVGDDPGVFLNIETYLCEFVLYLFEVFALTQAYAKFPHASAHVLDSILFNSGVNDVLGLGEPSNIRST